MTVAPGAHPLQLLDAGGPLAHAVHAAGWFVGVGVHLTVGGWIVVLLARAAWIGWREDRERRDRLAQPRRL